MHPTSDITRRGHSSQRSPVRAVFALSLGLATLAVGACAGTRGVVPDDDTRLDRAAAVGKTAAQIYVGTVAGAPLGVGMALGEAAQDRLASGGAQAPIAQPAADPARKTLRGAEVAIGRGTARAYVETVAGIPVEVGIALSESAMEGLPGHHDPGGVAMPDGHSMFEYVIDLPEGNPTPFRHVMLNWNPGGHEPPGIYDAPHFDFHFYTIPNEERKTIDPSNPHWVERARRLPPAEQVPEGYLSGSTLMKLEPEAASVPGMGMHWIDPRSPELNGLPFTATFIFGSWDGELTFAEPMITKAFLESRQDFTAELPAPASPAPGMYYPSRYRVRWDGTAREYRVSLGSPFPGS